MNALILWQEMASWKIAGLLLDASLKALLLLLFAGTCCFCWRRSSSATRHLIWFGAVLGALSFPLISWLLPPWQQPLWTVGSRLDPGNQVAVVVTLARNGPPPPLGNNAKPPAQQRPAPGRTTRLPGNSSRPYSTPTGRPWRWACGPEGLFWFWR